MLPKSIAIDYIILLYAHLLLGIYFFFFYLPENVTIYVHILIYKY